MTGSTVLDGVSILAGMIHLSESYQGMGFDRDGVTIEGNVVKAIKWKDIFSPTEWGGKT